MGNGALYMEEEKKKYCYLCKTEMTSSYFLRIGEGMEGKLVEVCPECHHWHAYAPKEMLEKYKKRRGIK